MARNRYFNQYSTTSEQNVYEDLIIESIKIYGVPAYYLPRTHVNLDKLYGEDGSMYFDDAIEIEMYIKTFDGFQGQLDFISKFGLQVDEQITFSLVKKRFQQAMKSCLMTEYNYNLIMEDGDELLYQNEMLSATDGRKIADYDYSGIYRPREGDLIWLPLVQSMYEIKFCEDNEYFFQLGKTYTYELRCDRFDYSSEIIDTDVSEIDDTENLYSLATNALDELLDEIGDKMLLEDSNTIILEGDVFENRANTADNDFITSSVQDEDVLDFSEANPFALTREW
ncbi:hypothetical protein EB118_19655 [bacterium]|nr:hypothetical protein [bacterium]